MKKLVSEAKTTSSFAALKKAFTLSAYYILIYVCFFHLGNNIVTSLRVSFV